jgi:uncharacterized caspase-like protein
VVNKDTKFHLAIVYRNRALSYKQKGDLDAALAEITKSIARNPKYANVYPRKKAGTARGISFSKGMAAMSAEDGGLLIAFVTSPGQIAQDGDSQNSPFTTALLKHLDAPGIEMEQLQKRVKKDV